ncbi:MAG: ribosomal-processing cysteine protease Prp [Treponema sp.]|uniref:ribosomal-processing cysteine protease Prp n=1 Tax=Treponema sp. TaxID=166 RepID=UPI003FA26E0A
MIRILVELDAENRLLSFEAAGHANYGARGCDIVCAAVTILLRTTVQALSSVEADVRAEKRGNLQFRVLRFDDGQAERLRYAAEFLWLGITSLQEEYPQALQCKKIQR